MLKKHTIEPHTSKEKKQIAINRKNVYCLKKRLLDYVISIPLLILSLPLMVVVYLTIKIVSPKGSPFFIQKREGLGGKEIQVIKFRTMHQNASERLQFFLLSNDKASKEWYQFYKLDPKKDPRLIYLGNFMRKSSIDELPNLFNVIMGDMSLVGPRPFPYYHLETYDKDFRELRSTVWPGITGIWQIKRGDRHAQKKFDTQYIENWSFKLDIKILMLTIPKILLSRKTNY